MTTSTVERLAPICGCFTDLPITRGMCRICYQRWLEVTPKEDRPPLEAPPLRNFDDYVDRTSTPDGCWPWTIGVAIERRTHGWWSDIPGTGYEGYAHRYALIRATGEEPPGLSALHTCDYPPCCREEHLYWGTQADNVRDMIDRGRSHFPGRQEVCQRGHSMSGSNAKPQQNGRYCAQCKIERQRRSNNIRAAAVVIADLVVLGCQIEDPRIQMAVNAYQLANRPL